MTPRKDYDDFFPESAPRIRTEKGIKARSQKGKIGQSWWAERWIAALEQVMDAGRLRRGRSYARSGQVLSIEETAHGVKARVQGSRPTPYKITIQLQALTDQAWEQAIDQMAAQASFSAQLLAGEMPSDIEEAFQTVGASPFPTRTDDLMTDCSCPDWANPCKHVAATYYILGEQFDEDPFMIFRLRGRTQEQILQGLRARRAGEAQPEEAETRRETPETVVPLQDLIPVFWQPAERLETFSTAIKPPAVRLPLLKRLGPPTFLPDEDLARLLAPAYEAITEQALAAAYESTEQNESEASE